MNKYALLKKWFVGQNISKFCFNFAFISLVLGSFAISISTAVLEGLHKKIYELAFRQDSHIKISTFNGTKISNLDYIKSSINSQFKNPTIYPIIESKCLVKYDNESNIFLIKVVDRNYLKNKFQLDIKDSSYVIISENNIEKLSDNKSIIFFYKDLSSKNSKLSIQKSSINYSFKGAFYDIDENIIFIDYGLANKLFKETNLTYLEIDFPSGIPESNEILELEKKLGFPYFVQSAKDIHIDKITWIELQKKPIPIILGLITLVAVSNIITGLLVFIVEKFRSIGILRVLGLERKTILRLFLIKGFKFGLSSSLIGYGIAFIIGNIVSYFELIKIPMDIYFVNALPIIFKLDYFLIIISVSIFLSVVVSIIPGIIATRISPISSIKRI